MKAPLHYEYFSHNEVHFGLHKRGTVRSFEGVEGACSARFEEGVVRFVLSSHCVCARVRPCVPCVSRLPPVSFYRYSSGPFQRILICPLATTRNAPECPARSLPG